MIYLVFGSGWILIGMLNFLLLDRQMRKEGNFFHFIAFVTLIPLVVIIYFLSFFFSLLEIFLFRSGSFRQL